MKESSAAALTTLGAFIGAVFGFVGCVAAALKPDVMLSEGAACGAAVCASIWLIHLDPTVAFEAENDAR